MAKPRIFISSTYYDLKHLRSAFESFLDDLGFEPVLSEKGSIAYTPDLPLDESCYREVELVDVLVLVVGGRYGSEKTFGNSPQEKKRQKEFYDRYDSVTREEFRAAVKNNIPTYILIERGVYSEYQTFSKNRNSTSVVYAHVDSVNIFHMIDEIVSLPKNNPIFSFDRYNEIETWLREQWASLFKELLQRQSNQKLVASLASQVEQLSQTNKTLRKYLESVMVKVAPDTSQALIDSETARLKKLKMLKRISENPFVDFLRRSNVDLETSGNIILHAESIKDLFEKIKDSAPDCEEIHNILDEILENKLGHALHDINDAREALGKKSFTWKGRKVSKRNT